MRAYLEIEMPKDGCTNCPLARRGSIFSRICVITEEYVDGNYERGGFPTECPLQKLQPHGRLIDADALIAELPNNLGIRGLEYLDRQESAIVSWIYAAPTIIPASGRAQEVET